MDFRIINDETLPKIMELWDYCFEKNDTPFFKWYFNEYCLKENMVLGGFDEKSGKLMNMLHLNPYTINLRGRQTFICSASGNCFFGFTGSGSGICFINADQCRYLPSISV